MQQKHSAFTLVELLCTVAIVGILVGVSLPIARDVITRQQNNASLLRLRSALSYAREQAIAHNRIVTICPSIDRQVCVNDWQQPLLIFTDEHVKGKIDADDELLRVIIKNQRGHLSLAAFPTSRYFRFHPNGFTDNQNGTFHFCAGGVGWQLAVNRAGRLREEKDDGC